MQWFHPQQTSTGPTECLLHCGFCFWHVARPYLRSGLQSRLNRWSILGITRYRMGRNLKCYSFQLLCYAKIVLYSVSKFRVQNLTGLVTQTLTIVYRNERGWKTWDTYWRDTPSVNVVVSSAVSVVDIRTIKNLVFHYHVQPPIRYERSQSDSFSTGISTATDMKPVHIKEPILLGSDVLTHS